MTFSKWMKELHVGWVAAMLVAAWALIWGSWWLGRTTAPKAPAPAAVVSAPAPAAVPDGNSTVRVRTEGKDLSDLSDALDLQQTVEDGARTEPAPAAEAPLPDKDVPPPGLEKVDWLLGQWPTIASILIALPFILTRWRNFFKGKDVDAAPAK